MRKPRLRHALLPLALCTATLAPLAQEPLRITVGAGTANAKRYDTSATTTVTTVDGASVVLKRSSGRDYSLEAGHHGWSWFQLQQVPEDESYIALTPRLQGQAVSLDITLSVKEGTRTTALETTASGSLGEWIVVLGGNSGDDGTGGRRYSSGGELQQLAVKIEKLP